MPVAVVAVPVGFAETDIPVAAVDQAAIKPINRSLSLPASLYQ
jgi:hypothetical protein